MFDKVQESGERARPWRPARALRSGVVAGGAFAVAAFGSSGALSAQITGSRAVPGAPVVVTIDININSISNINTVDQTYQIDGYLVLQWTDSTLVFDRGASGEDVRFIENDQLEGQLGETFWWPTIEFMNLVGEREVPNRRLVVRSNGRVLYNERFNATFTTKMDFRRFPFDSQDFKIEIESFSFDTTQVVFRGADVPPGQVESPSWKFAGSRVETRAVPYPHLSELEEYAFSHYDWIVTGERVPGYFIWQFFLPLFLLVALSWVMLWIDDFSDQLAVGFTLMLTVVAFNFYVTTFLPQLPDITFIEAMITSGYVVIVVIILFVVVAHVASTRGRARLADSVVRACRWVVPVAYGLSVVALWKYFVR